MSRALRFFFISSYLIEFNLILNGKEIILGDAPVLLAAKADFEMSVLIEKVVNAYESGRRYP